MKITPDNIVRLKPNEIFVFGSNEQGRHGKGAALTAMKFGAIYGRSIGIQGNTYAIPTVKRPSSSRSPDNRVDKKVLQGYVDDFYEFARKNTNLEFLVTEVGCGLAGFSIDEIAPMFERCSHLANVSLPKRFWDALK